MDNFFDECEKFIPKNAMAVHNILNNKGYNTYFVGGALRDYCISKLNNIDCKIKDWDITTTARHKDLMILFNKLLRLNENGRVVSRKGKAELLIADIETTGVCIDKSMFEVTPMNIKRNGNVLFTDSLIEDLSTRDFTINAMAYSPKLGVVSNFKTIDGVQIDSLNDLNEKLIKTVADPNISFKENRSNMMRGLLFSNRLNFEIEDDTLEAIRDNIFDVNYINKGKLSQMFERLILSEPTDKLEYLLYVGLFESLILNFNKKLSRELINNLYDMKNKDNLSDYVERLKFIYNSFSDKDLLLGLYREFGVNKNIISLISEI